MDIAFCSRDNESLSVYTNNGSDEFSFIKSYETGLDPGEPVVCDVDMDGNKDLLLSNSTKSYYDWGKKILVLRNTGDAVFEKAEGHIKYSYSAKPVISDVNRDGYLDMLLTFINIHRQTFAVNMEF